MGGGIMDKKCENIFKQVDAYLASIKNYSPATILLTKEQYKEVLRYCKSSMAKHNNRINYDGKTIKYRGVIVNG